MTFKRSPCPLANTLDLFGDKWTLLVIRDLFAGKTHFKDFSSSPEKIATNILTDRLNKLIVAELAEQFPSEEVPGKFAYRLTKKGQSVFPIIDAMARWGLQNVKGTKAYMNIER